MESQKVVVDALFAAQEERNQKAIRRERWVGFGFGVASSIVASTLVGIATFFLKRRAAKKVDDETEEGAVA